VTLFDDDETKVPLARVLNGLNRKYGEGAITVGVHGERQVPLRIPFGVPDTT
jgi:hypothetical protein